jgi:hypothetical protein
MARVRTGPGCPQDIRSAMPEQYDGRERQFRCTEDSLDRGGNLAGATNIGGPQVAEAIHYRRGFAG